MMDAEVGVNDCNERAPLAGRESCLQAFNRGRN